MKEPSEAYWAFDPEQEVPVIRDECPFCGAPIDDDTELFFDTYYASAKCISLTLCGCENCITSFSAYEAQRRCITHLKQIAFSEKDGEYHIFKDGE